MNTVVLQSPASTKVNAGNRSTPANAPEFRATDSGGAHKTPAAITSHMKTESCEFRIDEDFAHLLFEEGEGVRLGTSVRKVVVRTDDPKYRRVGELQNFLNSTEEKPFFYGWKFHRVFDKSELATAERFHVEFLKYFEPAGEENGTRYDEDSGCPACGSGAKQIGALVLPARRLPKSVDFASTIGGEKVASARAKRIFERERISGVEFGPIVSPGKVDDQNGGWFQLTIKSATVSVVPPTLFGIGPFDMDDEGMYRCPAGDKLGLNRLSVVTIERATQGKTDFISSAGYVGVRRGLLRPERLIFVSQKVRQLIESERLRGLSLEVAQLT